jgi:hypothetical protein
MIGKKINQLATELAPVSTDLTIIGDPISGVSKKITLAQLGAIFSGAVSFYTDLASFPATGDINVIYCAKDTQKLYLWSGSAYTEVFPSQALLDTYQLRSEKGNANGYASLDSGGKVPISQLPSSIMEYKGMWNAATNTPTLANGTGDTGDVYICNVAGTVNFGAGNITFAVGDYVIYSGTIWQRSSGAVGTVTSVSLTVGGDAISVSGSPLTTSGTLGLTFNGTTAQYIRGNGTLETFPTLTGFVPYTGATANVNLGTFNLTADVITGATGSYTSSGGGNTLEVTHSSGSGIALNITKGGNGEGLYINKTSGSGNAATIIGTLNATTLVKSGGTSAQFLKADGSVDSNTYVTIDTFETITASKNFALGLSLGSAGGTNQASVFQNTSSLFSGSAGVNVFGFNSANNIYFGKGSDNGGVLQWSNSTVRYYTLPNATGTLALTSDLTGGTVTSVGLSSATSGVTIGSTPITTSGTITLAIATASGSQQGLLSSTDWTTFNNKQNALTNPVTGTGTTNYLPKFTGASTIGNSQIFDTGSEVRIFTTSTDARNFTLGVYGVTWDNTLLEVANDVTVFNKTSADNGSLIEFRTVGGQRGDIRATTSSFSISSRTSLIFGSNNTDNMRLDASGNLGLGVTPSAWANPSSPAFQIKRASLFSYNSITADLGYNLYFNGSDYIYIANDEATLFRQQNGAYEWYQAPSGTAGNAISLTQAMTLNASGNLSIGNTNDTYKLDVTGTGRFTGTITSQITGTQNLILNSTNSAGGYIQFERSGTIVGYLGNAGSVTGSNIDDIALQSGASLRLQTGGNNTRLTIASTGAATFSSTITATKGFFSSNAASDSTTALLANASTNDSTTYAAIFGSLNAGYRMVVRADGNVGIGTTSPNARLTVVANDSSNPNVALRLSSTAYSGVSYPNTSLRFGSDYPNFPTWNLASIDSSYTGSNWGGSLLFFTNNDSTIGNLTERMRITSAGEACIGRTTAYGAGFLLNVQGNIYASAGIVTGAPSGENSATWKLGDTRTGTCVPSTWGEFSSWFTGTVANIEINGTTYTIPVVNAGYC